MTREERKRKRREEKRQSKKEERRNAKQQGRAPTGGAEGAAGKTGNDGAGRLGKKRKLDADGSGVPNGREERKQAGPARPEQAGQKAAPRGAGQDLAQQLRLPDGEMRARGAKPLSRKERKKAQGGQARGGEDRLDQLVAEYKNKYFQGGGGPTGSKGAPQNKALIAQDLSRWYE